MNFFNKILESLLPSDFSVNPAIFAILSKVGKKEIPTLDEVKNIIPPELLQDYLLKAVGFLHEALLRLQHDRREATGDDTLRLVPRLFDTGNAVQLELKEVSQTYGSTIAYRIPLNQFLCGALSAIWKEAKNYDDLYKLLFDFVESKYKVENQKKLVERETAT